MLYFFFIASNLLLFFYAITFLNFSSLYFKVEYIFKYIWIYKTLVLTIIIMIILLSLLPITNSWLWSNFLISNLFSIVNFYEILIYLISLVLIIYWNLSYSNILLLFIFNYYNFNVLLILLSFVFLSNQNLLHYFIFWCVFLSSLYHSTESSYWLHLNYGFNEFCYYFYNSLKTDSPFLFSSKSILNYDLYKIKNINWWYDFTSLDFKIFTFFLSNNNFQQIFIHDVDVTSFCVLVTSIIENLILNLILAILLNFFLKNNKKIIIVF